MQEILDVLRRVHRGDGASAIERVTGRSRSTVRRWTAIALELGWTKDVEPDEALALEVLRSSRPGRPPAKSETTLLLEPHRARVREWLGLDEPGSRGISLVKVHRLLAREGVKRVSFLPVLIDKRLRPEVLRNGDPRFEDAVRFMEWVSEGFDHHFAIAGDEVIVTAAGGAPPRVSI